MADEILDNLPETEEETTPTDPDIEGGGQIEEPPVEAKNHMSECP